MINPLTMFKVPRLQPPVRRVLALDAGSRCFKLLLAESNFGRLRVLKEELIDLQAEGLVSADETKAHLRSMLEAWGGPPLALVLPQHISISQVVDLPLAPENEVAQLIQDETLKLSGVSDSRVVYDFVRTDTAAKNRQRFWVTLCQEGDIRDRILRLGIEPQDLCELTTTANALIAAYRATCPLASRAIIVHLGAQSTVVVVLAGGQGAFASSFQMGGDFFTRSLARLETGSEPAAEARKRSANLLAGPDASAEFAEVVDGWVAELKRQLQEWFEANPGMAQDPASFDLIASGGGFDQPGLVEYLKSSAGLDLKPWPAPDQPAALAPSKGLEVAFGAALQALGYSARTVSLLPEDYRAAWRRRLLRQKVELGTVLVALVCLLLLVAGSWRQLSLIQYKKALLDKVRNSQTAVDANDTLTERLLTDYENLRPFFQAQQTTADTLNTLALLQQSRSNRSFWYVLAADQQSYFNPPPAMCPTNKPAGTNAPPVVAHPPSPPAGGTNLSPAKPGFIAELCVPEDAEAARAAVSRVVAELKQQQLFSKVDSLSDDLRRNLADSKVIVTDRHFALVLDFAVTDFHQPLHLKKPPRSAAKRPPPRPSWTPAEASDKVQVLP